MDAGTDQVHQVHHEADENEVSSCVLNLIQAFTNGLNIFKRLRERRQTRKARKENRDADRRTGAELQLSESLRRGPRELAQRYTECRAGMGRNFAKGDALAHASLAETLIKLNTGLISIISASLDNKNGKNYLDLDYKSLTNLSDTSRREALHSMTQLYERLSQSQMQIYVLGTSPCQCCSDPRQGVCPKSDNAANRKKKHRDSAHRLGRSWVTKMSTKSSNESRLVVIRPKKKRKSGHSSNGSNSVTSGPSAIDTLPWTSPLPNPIFRDSLQVRPLNIKASSGVKVGRERKRGNSSDSSKPVPWPHSNVYAAPESARSSLPELPASPVSRCKHRSGSPSHFNSYSPPPQGRFPVRRRTEKATPSSYTFASDSTKIGEIPQRQWTTPWDYKEAERLNALVADTRGLTPVSAADKASKKKGIFGFLKRGSTAGIVS